MDNHTIAQCLRTHANALGECGADLYRRRAFRRAADVLLRLDVQVAELLVSSGRQGLAELPGIGSSLADAIEQLIRTGTFVPRPRRSRPRLPCGLVELPESRAG
jgi:DNA polymerase/3'-5' exonuclease PolX